jgi:hypothetical protein
MVQTVFVTDCYLKTFYFYQKYKKPFISIIVRTIVKRFILKILSVNSDSDFPFPLFKGKIYVARRKMAYSQNNGH